MAERRSPAAGCPPLSRSCRDHRRPTSVRSPTRPVPRSARRILHWRAESKRTAGTDELTERSPALPLGRRRSRVAPRRRWSEDELQLRHSPRLSPVERRRSRPGDVLPNVRVRRRSRGGATMDINPSGAQLRITWGDQRATGVEGCGGIRCCEVGDRPVLDPYPVDSMYDAAHAAPLIPGPTAQADCHPRGSCSGNRGRYGPDDVAGADGGLAHRDETARDQRGAGAGREAPRLRDAPYLQPSAVD